MKNFRDTERRKAIHLAISIYHLLGMILGVMVLQTAMVWNEIIKSDYFYVYLILTICIFCCNVVMRWLLVWDKQSWDNE